MTTIALGLATALLWGAPNVPLAVAVRRVGAMSVLVGALAIGVLVALPGAALAGEPRLTVHGMLLAGAAGVLTAAAYTVGNLAFGACPVSIVTPILSCEGAIAAVISLLGGARVQVGLLGLLAAAVAGVVLVGAGGGPGAGYDRRGLGLCVLAALIWGAVLAVGPSVARSLGTYWAFLFVRLFALGAVLPIVSRRGTVQDVRREPWRIAFWGICDTAAYGCYYAAAVRGPVALAGVLAAQFATFGSLTGVVLLGERLRRRQWAGIGIVLAAVSGIAALSG